MSAFLHYKKVKGGLMKTARAIRELVPLLVERESRKGKAVEALEKLQKRLESDLAKADDPEDRRRINADLQYVIGYAESPHAAFADLCSVTAETPRAEAERRKRQVEEIMLKQPGFAKNFQFAKVPS
jgi:hypothetical protein